MNNSLTDPEIIRRLEMLEKDFRHHKGATLTMLERIRQVEKEISVLRSNVKEGDNILADFDEVEEANNE